MFSLFKKKDLLDTDDQERIVAAIRSAESGTTCELRVFIESRCEYMDALDKAKELFVKLGMANTERRNAVIVYMALDDHQFAIFGDEEIYTRAGGPIFWETAAEHLIDHLKQGQIADGLVACINELAEAMAQHFPYDPAVHRNELPDEIVFGK
ncbi:MAG TPA: TPM domain-containing protein [Flavipsychrobacter sp.]|nr:TPM domain-containing protein [Flavipsychrobacter sp.]